MKNPGILVKNIKEIGRDKLIDYIGLYFIGILSLGYLLFGAYFAKLHVYSYFLNAPFFLGDIIFLICFSLFVLKRIKSKGEADTFTYLFLFYFYFVAIKALVGYFYWGPLALRHTVLFLYPLFAAFSFSYYRKDFFDTRRKLVFIIILLIVLRFFIFYSYSVFTFGLLALVLINVYPKGMTKYFLYFGLLLCIPYKMFFVTSRTFLVGNFFSFILISFGFIYLLKIKKIYKFIFLAFSIIVILFGVSKFSIKNEVRSLIGLEELANRYSTVKEVLRVKEGTFIESKLPVKLYNEKDSLGAFEKSRNVSIVKSSDDNRKKRVREPWKSLEINEFQEPKKSQEVNKKITSVITADHLWPADRVESEDLKRGDRGISVPYMNSLFRILIWEDAFKKLVTKRPVLGFDFGDPFRCRALEILDWAAKEWSRDGWISFHNSYIDIIYRAGLVGILMIAAILILFLFIIGKSFQDKSLNGILLSGILLNWLIAATFSEALEMPYTAIPLWSLFGMTFAYLFKNKTT